MKEFKLTQKGFSILEVILAAAIFVFLGSSAVIVVIQGLNTNRLGAEYSVATQFASEGIEGVRSIKNRDFAALVDTAGCGIVRDKVQGQDVWTFQASCTDNRLTHNSADEYIRTIKVEPVYRNGVPPAGDIVAPESGTLDLNTKKITSTVTWNFTSNRPETVTLVAYLSDWKKEISNPPTVTTKPANAFSTTATLNGTGDPNWGVTTGWFRYDTVDPGTCNDTFGVRAPASGGSPLGSGNLPVDYSENISGLSSSTRYYFCAVASNSGGTSLGTVVFFDTTAPITPPTVTTLAATTPVPETTATINATANPNGDATTGYFRYDTTNPGTCNDTFGTRVPVSGGTNLGSGTSPLPYSENLTGLTPSTPYHFCALASNGGGTSLGTVLSFTTADPPPPEVNFVASVTATGNNPASGNFTLPGTAQPGDLAVFWWYTSNSVKTITPPGTITQKQNAFAAGFGRLYIGYRRLQSGDSTFAWTSSTASNSTTVWGTSVFTGVISTGDPFEAQSGAPATFSNTSSPNPPSVTSLTNNAMVFTLFGKNNDFTTLTNPAGYTTAGSNDSTTGNDAAAAAAYFKKVTAGLEDPGAFSAAGASTDDGYVWTGALKPGT